MRAAVHGLLSRGRAEPYPPQHSQLWRLSLSQRQGLFRPHGSQCPAQFHRSRPFIVPTPGLKDLSHAERGQLHASLYFVQSLQRHNEHILCQQALLLNSLARYLTLASCKSHSAQGKFAPPGSQSILGTGRLMSRQFSSGCMSGSRLSSPVATLSKFDDGIFAVC